MANPDAAGSGVPVVRSCTHQLTCDPLRRRGETFTHRTAARRPQRPLIPRLTHISALTSRRTVKMMGQPEASPEPRGLGFRTRCRRRSSSEARSEGLATTLDRRRDPAPTAVGENRNFHRRNFEGIGTRIKQQCILEHCPSTWSQPEHFSGSGSQSRRRSDDGGGNAHGKYGPDGLNDPSACKETVPYTERCVGSTPVDGSIDNRAERQRATRLRKRPDTGQGWRRIRPPPA